jgi:menaquinone-9 beta-reductase
MPGPVIIGGGPAGATAAIILARAGHAVTLIERTVGATEKVCGDFLSAEAIEAIADLGVDVPALAPSQIRAVRLVHGNRAATVRLPFPALGLTRRALDETLLRQAQLSGATILRGRSVLGIDRSGGSLRIDCGSLGRLAAGTVFLATGKHDLRGAARTERGTGLVGMKMYFALDSRQRSALQNHVELVLFAGGYAGLQLVESDQAVLCVLVPGARLRSTGGRWDYLFDSLLHECPHLADRLAGARPLLERPRTIAGLPYGYTHASDRQNRPDLFRLGDQATVIASLTGDGVALALASATLASRVWLAEGNVAGSYHRAWAQRTAPQMRLATFIHRACLAPTAQPWLLRLCRSWPRIIRLAAARTRLRVGGSRHTFDA